jgi:hypothetical protein
MSADDFYVPDEPVEDVRAAYESGEKGLTSPPRSRNWTNGSLVWPVIFRSSHFTEAPDFGGVPMVPLWGPS